MATPTNLPASFTVGQVLTAAQMNDLRGAFRVLQIVEGSTTTTANTVSTTYADTGLTANITCQSTSSKVLVMLSQDFYTSAANTDGGVRLLRGATQLSQSAGVAFSTAGGVEVTFARFYLDSPASTSALTYKTTFARISGAGTFFAQPNTNRSNIILVEVSA